MSILVIWIGSRIVCGWGRRERGKRRTWPGWPGPSALHSGWPPGHRSPPGPHLAAAPCPVHNPSVNHELTLHHGTFTTAHSPHWSSGPPEHRQRLYVWWWSNHSCYRCTVVFIVLFTAPGSWYEVPLRFLVNTACSLTRTPEILLELCTSDPWHYLTVAMDEITSKWIKGWYKCNDNELVCKDPWEAHPLEGAGSEDPLVLLGVELLPKQDVAPDGAREDPRLLTGVGQLAPDLDHTCVQRQLSQDGAEQRGLRNTGNSGANQHTSYREG